MPDLIPMTRSGVEKLKAELDDLENVRMPEVTARVAEARGEGDLKENAEYHGARETQGMIQAKINELRDKLARASIVDMSKLPKDEVVFGCTVKVKDLKFGDTEEFTLSAPAKTTPTKAKSTSSARSPKAWSARKSARPRRLKCRRG